MQALRRRLNHVSMKRILYLSFLIVLIPSTILLCVMLLYNWQSENRRLNDDIRNAEERISTAFLATNTATSHTLLGSGHDVNYFFFCNSSNPQRLYQYAMKASSTFSAQLFREPEATAIFFYNTKADYLYANVRYIASSEAWSEIAPFMEDVTDVKHQMKQTLVTISGKTYLLSIVTQRWGNLCLLLDPERNEVFLQNATLTKTGSIVFTDVPADTIISRYPVQKVGETGLSLQFEPFTNSLHLTPLQATFLYLLLLLVTVNILTILFIRGFLLLPLEEIGGKMQEISQGNTLDRIPPVESVKEISEFGQLINQMLDSIQEKDAENFNSRMDVVQAKLQYLQLQIRPHFLLNCMKNIHSLIQLDKKEEADTLLLAMSNYISYTFSDVKNFISIRDELASVENYVKLCNMLANRIDLKMRIDNKVLKDPCLPLSVLTFVENSIKHSRSDSQIEISICVNEDPAASQNVIIIRDNGGGFPEEVIKEFYSFDPGTMPYRRIHIGVANVRYRLWLVYREETSIDISNEGQSAVVIIRLPKGVNNESVDR